MLQKLKNLSEQKDLVITTETPLEMLKTGNRYLGRVTKQTTMIVRVNEDYEEAVNDMRKEEGVRGKFTAKKLPWGQHVPNSPLIEHKGNYYLQARIMSSNPPIYFLDGKECTYNQLMSIKAYVPEKKEGTGRQKTDEEVVIRTIKLENIIALEEDK